MTMFIRPLIIFDSGIGGLSILKALLQLNSNYPFVYFADQAYFPYGSRSAHQLRHRLLQIFRWFAHQQPIGVVVACNTATSISLDELRQLFPFPIIGVEPVIKPLAQYSPSLLLATPLTINSDRTHQLIQRYQPSQLHLHPAKHLASYIETMDFSSVQQELAQIKTQHPLNFEVIGLSCTHYPFIKPLIQQTFPQAKIIDPSLAVAKRVTQLILPLSSSSTFHGFTTGNLDHFRRQLNHYLDLQAVTSNPKLSFIDLS